MPGMPGFRRPLDSSERIRLFAAVSVGQASTVEEILAVCPLGPTGLDPSAWRSRHPFSSAAAGKRSDIAKMLLPHLDANAWLETVGGLRTPLMIAVEANLVDLARELLPHCDPRLATTQDETAMSIALRSRSDECVALLAQSLNLAPSDATRFLWGAIQTNNPAAVQSLLAIGDPMQKDKKGLEALSLAAVGHAPRVIRLLLSDPRIAAEGALAADRALWFAFGGTNRTANLKPPRKGRYASGVRPASLAPIGLAASAPWCAHLLQAIESDSPDEAQAIGALRARLDFLAIGETLAQPKAPMDSNAAAPPILSRRL